MKDSDTTIFIGLFKEACEKCFGFPLTSSLSEADSKHLSNKILEHTGLVIGAKSMKNYSLYVLNTQESKKENPSVATLDTLARYVLDASYTDEVQRKDHESHYPYWFQYRSRFSNTRSHRRRFLVNRKKAAVIFFVLLGIAVGLFALRSLTKNHREEDFTDNFDAILEDSLSSKGWMMKSVDTTWWNRRNEKPGHLTLYTLTGDNWPNAENPAGMKNLLMRRISADCFMVEIHLTNFIPRQNWQQAGILLSEDSTFTSKALRLSISYNDFFGGYEKPAEIIIQAMSSSESGGRSKPEEIAHFPLFTMEPGEESLVASNLATAALKIEKKGNQFRFLYTADPIESFAFKEVISGDFTIQPKYVALFAIQGWADHENYMPVYFDTFSFESIPCSK